MRRFSLLLLIVLTSFALYAPSVWATNPRPIPEALSADIATSLFDRFIVGVAERVRSGGPASSASPTPIPAPSATAVSITTPKTGPSTWIFIGILASLFIGNWMRKLTVFDK